MMARTQSIGNRCLARPRTVERCETYIDRLSDLIADAGKDWLVYRPLVERLERELREAREEITLHERMMRRQRRDTMRAPASRLPRAVHLVFAGHPGAWSIEQAWAQTCPQNMALNAGDKRFLMMACRHRKVVRACKNGMAIIFVR